MHSEDNAMGAAASIPWWQRWDAENGTWARTPRFLRLQEAYGWGCSDVAATAHAGVSDEEFAQLKTSWPRFTEWRDKQRAKVEIDARKALGTVIGHAPKMAWEYLQAVDPKLKKKQEMTGNGEGGAIVIKLVGADPEDLKL